MRKSVSRLTVRIPSALTEEALEQIGQLYAIEADIRGMPAEQRLAERQRKTKPLLKSLESWLREKMKTLSRHSELAKAFAYALNQHFYCIGVHFMSTPCCTETYWVLPYRYP